MADRQSAVRKLSGKPVPPSGPVLGNGPTPLATADRTSEACLPLSSSQAKTGREFEGGALISAKGAVRSASPSLDELQINRDRPEGLKRHCSRWTVWGKLLTDPKHTRFCNVGCKCWGCSACGPRKAKRYRIRIAQVAEQYRMSTLLTLTLDRKKLRGKDSTRYINEVFADFRVYLRRRFGCAPQYIRILEYQKNGNAHLHILLNRFVPQAWVSQAWERLGGGRIVDIRRVDIHRVSHYLSKYLTKEMLLHAPKRARRVTCSKDLRLFEKQPRTHEWQIIRIPILRLFDVHRDVAKNIKTYPEGQLFAFDTTEGRVGESIGIDPDRTSETHPARQIPEIRDRIV